MSDWAAIATAAGTFAAAAAAVWVALWTARRSDRKLREDRALERRREQLAEAYAVRVVQGKRPASGQPSSDPKALVVVAVVVNCGHYTITGVEVKFSPDGKSLVSPRISERVSSFTSLPSELQKHGETSAERPMRGILTPWDAGMRSEPTDEVGVRLLPGYYAVVRWTDRWGMRWEHRRGEVQQVRDGQEWARYEVRRLAG